MSDQNPIPPSGNNPNPPSRTPGTGNPLPPPGSPPPIPASGGMDSLTTFPVILAILLHYLTCGIFSIIWLNVIHGKLPKVRSDDPSAGKAVGFCFIPFFNLYWIFFTYRRLCLRVDEARQASGLPSNDLTGLATATCVLMVIPYVNILGYLFLSPVFIGQMQSTVNELAERGVTTAPPGQQTTPRKAGLPGWAIALIACACCFLVLIPLLAALLLPALAKAKSRAQRIMCVNNLKQVGLAARMWALDNNEQFPFNVSTNSGGTLEFCLPGADGFDQNAWHHFQALSNQLNTAKILICPLDHDKQVATDFSHLQEINVTYQMFSGTNISDAHPGQILAICPIHHNILYSDGSVQQVSETTMREMLARQADSTH